MEVCFEVGREVAEEFCSGPFADDSLSSARENQILRLSHCIDGAQVLSDRRLQLLLLPDLEGAVVAGSDEVPLVEEDGPDGV